MDNPVLTIEAPILDDESAAHVHQFLQDLTLAFESCYYKQLVRHNRNCEPDCDNDRVNNIPVDQSFFDDEDPF